MKFELARVMVDHITACDVHLNKVADAIDAIENDEEKMQFRRRLAGVMGAMYDLLRPIEIEYPSLRN